MTFGAQVADNQRTRRSKSSKSGLPGALPGKFPSPWTPKHVNQKSEGDGDTTKSRSQTKMNEAGKDTAISSEMTKPVQAVSRATDDQTWEQKYDDYAQRTQREMKKLIAKQKAAKSYARDRDAKVMDLADRLKQEQRKVQKLEEKVAQLNARLEQYQDSPRDWENQPAKVEQLPIETLSKAQKDPEIQQRSARKSAIAPMAVSSRERSLPPKSPATTRSSARSGDLWADVMLSSPAVKINAYQAASAGRSVVESTKASPLRARDTNTMNGTKPASTPIGASSRRGTTSARSQRGSARRPQQLDDDLDDVPDLPQPSPDMNSHLISPLAARPLSSHKKADPSKRPMVAESSPFMSSPPQYDRFALPFSLPSPGPRSKRGAEMIVNNAAPERSLKGICAVENKENETGPATEKEDGRQQLDDERRAKAAARIAARRQKRAAVGS